MAAVPSPVRRYIVPQQGEDWAALAARALPAQDGAAAIAALQGWNLHIVYRPCPELLCSDIVFVEPSPGV